MDETLFNLDQGDHETWAREYDVRVIAVFLPDDDFARLMGAEASHEV
jgi:hypothetical protein